MMGYAIFNLIRFQYFLKETIKNYLQTDAQLFIDSAIIN